MRATHVRLLVEDYASCFRFYRDVVGLTVTYGDEEGPYCNFDTGEASIALFTRDWQSEEVELRPAGDGSLVILRVSDVDAEVERLGNHVVAGPVDREDWGICALYVRDPAGDLLELNQPL